MLIALGTILSLIRPFALPFGGEVTLASMMPICLIGFIYGAKTGVLSSLCFAVLQMLIGAGTITAAFLPGENQMVLGNGILMCVLDYLVAYMVLGFSGIFKNKIKNSGVAIVSGSIFATALRYITHIISGYILWGSYAEMFFGQEGFYAFGAKILTTFHGDALAFIYSLVYNGLYMVPEISITAATVPIVYAAIKKAKIVE